jgi:hypothetical protein
VVSKGKKIAAHLLEVSEADIEFEGGQFTVAGTDRAVPFAQIALAAYVPHNYLVDTVEPGLDETAFYDPTNFTYPAGAHIAEVEIDRDTGAVTLLNFTAADDFGRIINPLIAEGQVHDGLVQGIGQALYEHTVYDPESGQLRTGSLMDYCLPRRQRGCVQPGHPRHAVHAQPARRQRLRRGGHDRRAGRDNERFGQCARAARRNGFCHARDTGARVARHRCTHAHLK